MKAQVHILNGDSLFEIFPDTIIGSKIVMRECLVQGPIDETDLKLFFEKRASFIQNGYHLLSDINYDRLVVEELNKLSFIEKEPEINLWFEDDVFCQVNLWFILNLISKKKLHNNVYLVRPLSQNTYAFSGLNRLELEDLFKGRIKIEILLELSQFWEFYQNQNINDLMKVAFELQSEFPFLLEAVQAIKNSIPTSKSKGVLVDTLIQIKTEFQTEDFNIIFKEFSKRLPIYGFGDLQVKYLLNKISVK